MDEDSTARSLAFALKSRGINVITALEANRLRYSDEEQLLWAITKIFNRGSGTFVRFSGQVRGS
jgi:hypothetical protein